MQCEMKWEILLKEDRTSEEILPKLTPVLYKILSKSTSGAILEHFGHPLGAKMAQEWHQEQKMMKNLKFWGGLWGPKWSQNR